MNSVRKNDLISKPIKRSDSCFRPAFVFEFFFFARAQISTIFKSSNIAFSVIHWFFTLKNCSRKKNNIIPVSYCVQEYKRRRRVLNYRAVTKRKQRESFRGQRRGFSKIDLPLPVFIMAVYRLTQWTDSDNVSENRFSYVNIV